MGRKELRETLEEGVRKGYNGISISPHDLDQSLLEIARFPHVTYLSIWGDVTALPPEIGLLTHLTILSCCGTQLAELPAEIGQLTNLTKLELIRNQLKALPPEIGRLANLKDLHLEGNHLPALPPEVGRLSHLNDLRLDGNQLNALPAELGRLANLTRLGLTGNRLTVLPAEIGELVKLTELNLRDNQLGALPAAIGQLGSLTRLVLRGNRLAELPAEIGRLGSLTHLDLWGNRLVTLPPEIGGLSSLTELNLSGNRLEELPAEIGRLHQLTSLDLWGNQLKCLPAHCCQLTNLKSLVLHANPLSSPPVEVVCRGILGLLRYWRAQLPPRDREQSAATSQRGAPVRGKLARLEARIDPRNLASLQRLHQARRQTHWTWQGRSPDEWIERLAEPGKDRRHVFSFEAYEAIGRLGVSAVPALMGALDHADWRVRCGAASLLAALGPGAICARYALRRALTDTRARVRRAATEALLQIGAGAREATGALLARLATDSDQEVRTLAAQALGVLGSPEPPIIEGLLAALADPHAPLRRAAVTALAHLGKGIDSVAERLEEQMIIDTETAPLVATALARSAPERLARLLADDPNCCLTPRTRDGRAEVLMRLAALGPRAAPFRQAIVTLVSSPARVEALYALGRVGGAARDTVPAIARPLDEPARAALRSIYFASWQEAQSRRQAVERPAPRGSASEVLEARLQAGDLARERIELAAALGDGPSMRVLGWPCPPGGSEVLDECAFKSWADAMLLQPPEVRARIGHAVARDVLPLVQEWYLQPYDAIPIHALEDWLCSPSPENARRRAEARQWVRWPTQGWEGNSTFAARAVAYACDAEVEQSNPGATLREALSAWQGHSSNRCPRDRFAGTDRPFDLEGLPPDDAIRHVRRVVRAWVVPWALGVADPILEPLLLLSEDHPGAANHAIGQRG